MYTEIQELNVNKQARAILALLVGDDITRDYDGYIRTETSAWYNCRERGYAIVTSVDFERESLVLTFGEHRNSDSIFVDEWEMKPGLNPPTVSDFTDEAYANRKHFRYGECGKASSYIMERIRAYLSRPQETGESVTQPPE